MNQDLTVEHIAGIVKSSRSALQILLILHFIFLCSGTNNRFSSSRVTTSIAETPFFFFVVTGLTTTFVYFILDMAAFADGTAASRALGAFYIVLIAFILGNLLSHGIFFLTSDISYSLLHCESHQSSCILEVFQNSHGREKNQQREGANLWTIGTSVTSTTCQQDGHFWHSNGWRKQIHQRVLCNSDVCSNHW